MFEGLHAWLAKWLHTLLCCGKTTNKLRLLIHATWRIYTWRFMPLSQVPWARKGGNYNQFWLTARATTTTWKPNAQRFTRNSSSMHNKQFGRGTWGEHRRRNGQKRRLRLSWDQRPNPLLQCEESIPTNELVKQVRSRFDGPSAHVTSSRCERSLGGKVYGICPVP